MKLVVAMDGKSFENYESAQTAPKHLNHSNVAMTLITVVCVTLWAFATGHPIIGVCLSLALMMDVYRLMEFY